MVTLLATALMGAVFLPLLKENFLGGAAALRTVWSFSERPLIVWKE